MVQGEKGETMTRGKGSAPYARGDRNRIVEYEGRFARSFIVREKRDRFISFASTRFVRRTASPVGMKRWARYAQMLSNLELWLIRRANLSVLTAPNPETERVLHRLEKLGASEECYVMSLDRRRDGQFFPLADALQSCSHGDNHSSLLICCPESLAYYWHGEVVGASAILWKRSVEGFA